MWPSVLQIIYLLWMQTTKHFILLKSDVCKVMRRWKVTHVALQVGMQEAQTKVQQISPRYHDGGDCICALQIDKWFRGVDQEKKREDETVGNCHPTTQNKLFWFYTHQHSGFKCLPSKKSKRMIFLETFQRGRGAHFQSGNLYCRFCTFKQVFFSGKIAIKFSENEADLKFRKFIRFGSLTRP